MPSGTKRTCSDSVGAARRQRVASQSEPIDEGAAAGQLQAAWRGFHVRSAGIAGRTRLPTDEGTGPERTTSVAARLRTPDYRQIRRCCKRADVRALAEVDIALEALVGLQPLKDYCAALRGDCLARAALGDEPLVRNVLLSGSLGTGKKTAAQLICTLLRALGAAKGVVTTETTMEQLSLDVRRDVSCVVVEGLVGGEHIKAKVNAVLHNFPGHCFIFLGPTQPVEAMHGALPYFRKVEPAWLQLPPYTPAELSAIAAQRLRRAGYGLRPGLGSRDLQAALCSTWSRDVLAMRNAHLAEELVQRAISARNRRIPLGQLLASPLLLGEVDFGLESQGLQS